MTVQEAAGVLADQEAEAETVAEAAATTVQAAFEGDTAAMAGIVDGMLKSTLNPWAAHFCVTRARA